MPNPVLEKTLQNDAGTVDIAPRTTTHAISHLGESLETKIESLAPLASPTFTGSPKVAANANYATGQFRNIHFSTVAPTNSDGGNGDIWIVYTDLEDVTATS